MYIYIYCISWQSWWRHQMEIFSASLAICAGNSPVNGEFPAQRPVTRRFDVFFHLRLNKRLSEQSRGWWFETPSHPLWRHSNGNAMGYHRGYELHVKLTNCNMWHIGNCLLHVYYPWIFQSLISHRNNIQYDFITADIERRLSGLNCMLFPSSIGVALHNTLSMRTAWQTRDGKFNALQLIEYQCFNIKLFSIIYWTSSFIHVCMNHVLKGPWFYDKYITKDKSCICKNMLVPNGSPVVPNTVRH